MNICPRQGDQEKGNFYKSMANVGPLEQFAAVQAIWTFQTDFAAFGCFSHLEPFMPVFAIDILLLKKTYLILKKIREIFSKFPKYEIYFPNLFKIIHNSGYIT